MSVDVDSILTRKGLLDTVQLHRRWDRKLRLLKNNKPIVVHHPAGSKHTTIQNMDRLTWMMTLIVAALDAAVPTIAVTNITLQLLETLLQESLIGTEYLQREIHQHVQGWRSSACVRGILEKAYQTWAILERNGRHWPGHIPSGDHGEIQALFLWLISGKSSIFATGSGDVFCIAAILQELGMEITVTIESAKTDDHHVQVLYSHELFVARDRSTVQREERSVVECGFLSNSCRSVFR